MNANMLKHRINIWSAQESYLLHHLDIYANMSFYLFAFHFVSFNLLPFFFLPFAFYPLAGNSLGNFRTMKSKTHQYAQIVTLKHINSPDRSISFHFTISQWIDLHSFNIIAIFFFYFLINFYAQTNCRKVYSLLFDTMISVFWKYNEFYFKNVSSI